MSTKAQPKNSVLDAILNQYESNKAKPTTFITIIHSI